MVFRNLRERFGIDDQDYQVRDACKTGRVRKWSGVRKPQDKERKKVSTVLVLRLPVTLCSSPGSLCQCWWALQG